jgi:hypothetical protein
MVYKLNKIIATFVIILLLGYESTVSQWKWLKGSVTALNAARLRIKTTVLFVLLGIYFIHTTTKEGTRKGLKESGKLPSAKAQTLGNEEVQQVFLLVPNLLFSLYLTIGTLNIVATFMTYRQFLSITPYVEVYINVFTVLAYTEIFLKVAFLLKRKHDTLV